MLEIKIIQSSDELEKTEKIHIGYELWGTENMPETYARMGFVPEDGFYVKMVCMEQNPLRTYTKNQDPVCLDSAMELFLKLPSVSEEYMNFEMNANGAFLTAHGPNREKRTPFDKRQIEIMQHRADIAKDSWSMQFRIPMEILEATYGTIELKKGSTFHCNLYKVCQGRVPYQFGAYAYIPLEEPSFHEPEYFAEAVLV